MKYDFRIFNLDIIAEGIDRDSDPHGRGEKDPHCRRLPDSYEAATHQTGGKVVEKSS